MWGGASPFTLLAWLTAPMALNLIDFVNRERGRALNKALVGAGRLHLLFGVLFAIGLLFG
jgi:1,4-dihydroxy-2-naphthoate octaprenyltransferase